LRSIALAAALAVLSTGCVTTREQLGPQTFNEPSVPIAGGDDPEILRALEAAVSVSSEFGFRHDASRSSIGRVDVEALWKGRPVTLKMRFQRRSRSDRGREGIYVSSSCKQPADVFLEGGGQKIERLFYSRLHEVTTQRGLQIFGDPDSDPELKD